MQIDVTRMTVAELKAYQHDLTVRFAEKKAAQQELKLQMDDLEEEFRQIEQELWDMMESLGVANVTTPIGTFTKSSRIWPSVDDMDAFSAWAEETEQATMFLTTALRKSAFNEYIKGLIANGEELPPGVPVPEPRRYVTFKRR